MAKVEVVLPAMGEGIIEATITRWIAEKGTKIEKDEAIVEIATDKVDSELPSPATGVLAEVLFNEGEIPKVGQVIAIIQDERAESVVDKNEKTPVVSKKQESKTIKKPVVVEDSPVESTDANYFFSPFIQQLATNRGITYKELCKIKGSGVNGRLTKDDLSSYILQGRPFKEIAVNKPVSPSNIKETPESQEYKLQPGERMVEMDRTRKIIAQHMVNSKHTAPHVSSTVEIDVTNMVQWREKYKNIFLQEHGIKLTYTPLITLAVSQAIKKLPAINVSVFNDFIIEKDFINVGIATALHDGNLIVPIIKNTDQLNLKAIALKIADLSGRARENKLLPTEIQNGTFTITNMGQFGNITGFPIINQPQVAILAVGSIVKKPAVVTVDGFQSIGIRDILVLTMSYDHRVVDGALGGSFLKIVGDYLQSFPGELSNNIGF